MGSSRTILLVEDEPDNREAMALELRRHGYVVHAAADAVEAEAALNRGLPDLVISDMILPGASGFRIVALVDSLSEGRVPVLMISANTSRAHRDYALEIGANRFLAKPFALSELVAAAETLCPLPTSLE